MQSISAARLFSARAQAPHMKADSITKSGEAITNCVSTLGSVSTIRAVMSA